MKIDRILAMTVLLLNRGRVSARELAERFEVSTKTVYRDIETLCQAGIPIAAYQGTAGGFEIMDHYTMNRQLLTLGEISTIFAAVKGISTALDDQTFASLLEKVQALLSKSDRTHWEEQGEGMMFDFNPWGLSPSAKGKVSLLKNAIEQRQKVSISYTNMNGTESERTVEPAVLILKGNQWYLQAFCTLREDFRVFRLSRIQVIKITPQSFERRNTPTLNGYAWESVWSKQSLTMMTLRFSQEVRHRVRDSFHPDQITSLEDGCLRVQGQFTKDEWFFGMIMSYGEHVKIEEPNWAAEEVVKRAKQIIYLYNN
ncbi:helix-turn-helix transcriptional regulator [Paenibacillus pini]|uniref:Transcriptional regulator n=1 Tax=Paenibacillus pini JCM 16418 TaxID=1236976 RepID=W7YL23_9BACL|nr:YafY family protein [Paenibacillus pini]GAF08428.1 transcriptional regulator [Paenibacillus pini JCM 16418]